MYTPPPRIELPPRPELLESLRNGVLLGLAALVLLLPPAAPGYNGKRGPVSGANATTPATANRSAGPRFADFKGEAASAEAQRIAHWVTDSGDNRRQSFILLDKREARVFVFNGQGQLIAATPVLLGAAAGDDSVAGIGERPIAEVRPEERTTPAGRFDAEPGRNALGEDVLWVDYEAAVSMHRLRLVEASERRLERLASPTPADNRISYGCINVPVAFFDEVIAPTFKGRRGVVYVLPEVKPLHKVFAQAYDVAARHGLARPPCTTASCGRGPLAPA